MSDKTERELDHVEQATVVDWLTKNVHAVELQLVETIAGAIERGESPQSIAMAVTSRLHRMLQSDMVAATMAPEGRWYMAPEGRWYVRWRHLVQFCTWANPEAFQEHQGALRAAHEAKKPVPLPPTVGGLI